MEEANREYLEMQQKMISNSGGKLSKKKYNRYLLERLEEERWCAPHLRYIEEDRFCGRKKHWLHYKGGRKHKSQRKPRIKK